MTDASENDRPALPHLHASDGAEAVIAALAAAGGVIVEGVLRPDALAAFNRELDPLVAAADPARKHMTPLLDFFFGPRTRHVTSVAAKSPVFVRELLCHPLLMAVCDAVLKPSCGRYQLNLAHVLDRGPGAEAQILHRDELVWSYVPKPHPELQVATIVALEDFSTENGATRLVPGSHRWPKDRVATGDEVVDAEMPAGSAVIYLGSTIHGGGANTTSDQWRRGLHMSFVLGWLRTEENNTLGTPPDVARTLPREAQEMLGYAVHYDDLGAYLGHVDLNDPCELLAKGLL
jgi:ectoine hydroxylase-related dioxygenase (phytanoyl-CoA dioxygenase family)